LGKGGVQRPYKNLTSAEGFFVRCDRERKRRGICRKKGDEGDRGGETLLQIVASASVWGGGGKKKKEKR